MTLIEKIKQTMHKFFKSLTMLDRVRLTKMAMGKFLSFGGETAF